MISVYFGTWSNNNNLNTVLSQWTLAHAAQRSILYDVLQLQRYDRIFQCCFGSDSGSRQHRHQQQSTLFTHNRKMVWTGSVVVVYLSILYTVRRTSARATPSIIIFRKRGIANWCSAASFSRLLFYELLNAKPLFGLINLLKHNLSDYTASSY